MLKKIRNTFKEDSNAKETLTLFLKKFEQDKVNLFATQAAFYFIISAVPFLIFILSLLKYIYPISQAEFLELISQALPDTIQYWLIKILNSIYTESTVSLTSIAALTTLWSASKSTYALTQGLTVVYDVQEGNMALRNRVFSVVYTFFLAALLILFILVEVFSAPAIALIKSLVPGSLSFLIRLLGISSFISWIIIIVIFSFLYKQLSRSKIKLIYHLPGAIMASTVWIMFSWIFEIYINSFANFSVTYGSLAAIIIMMLWLKTCMNIFLLGGEVNVYIYFYHPFKFNK